MKLKFLLSSVLDLRIWAGRTNRRTDVQTAANCNMPS